MPDKLGETLNSTYERKCISRSMHRNTIAIYWSDCMENLAEQANPNNKSKSCKIWAIAEKAQQKIYKSIDKMASAICHYGDVVWVNCNHCAISASVHFWIFSVAHVLLILYLVKISSDRFVVICYFNGFKHCNCKIERDVFENCIKL